jgi:hypothetical protein
LRLLDMVVRIDAFMAAGEHLDGPSEEAGAMGGGVDAARKTGVDDEAGIAEVAREPAGEFHARGRGVARADNGDERAY